MVQFPRTVDVNEKTKKRTREFFNLLSKKGSQIDISLIDENVYLEAMEGNSNILHLAAKNGYPELVTHLIDNHKDIVEKYINSRNGEGDTPLHCAAASSNTYICGILLAAGADLEATNIANRTPLHHVIFRGRADAVRYLLAQGASIRTGNDDGNAFLHTAASAGQKEIAEILMARGVNIYAPNDRSKAAIDYKILKDNPLVKELQDRYTDFVTHRTAPESATDVYHLLSVYPLKGAGTPVDQELHLRQIFVHANWKDPAKAAAIIDELQKDGIRAELAESLQGLIAGDRSKEVKKTR